MLDQFGKNRLLKKTQIRYKGRTYRNVADLPEEARRQLEKIEAFVAKEQDQTTQDHSTPDRLNQDQTTYVINGKTYHKFSDIPLEDRKFLEDRDRDGFPDAMFEGMPGFVKGMFKVVEGLFRKISGIDKLERGRKQQGIGRSRRVTVNTVKHEMETGDWVRVAIMIVAVGGAGVLIYLINNGVINLD